MSEKKLISIKEAAKMLGVTPLTLRNWDNNGKLKAMRHPLNNYRVYKVEEIELLLKGMIDLKPAIYIPPKKKIIKLNVKHIDE
jgi:MerR family transcriptional regulator, copper efflux regulator